MTGRAREQGSRGPIGLIVAENIAQLCKVTKTSHAGLSNRLHELGVSIAPLGISRILKKNRTLTIDEAVALANAFGLELEDVLIPNATVRCHEKLVTWVIKEWPL